MQTSWDGRTASGRLAPDGDYHLRVDLRSLDRTITIPDPVVLDNTPPVVTIKSPAGATPVRYGVSERARVWAVARIENYTGHGDAPRASFRGRNGVVHFIPSGKIPPGTPISLVHRRPRRGGQRVGGRPGDGVAHARAVKENPAG